MRSLCQIETKYVDAGSLLNRRIWKYPHVNLRLRNIKYCDILRCVTWASKQLSMAAMIWFVRMRTVMATPKGGVTRVYLAF